MPKSKKTELSETTGAVTAKPPGTNIIVEEAVRHILTHPADHTSYDFCTTVGAVVVEVVHRHWTGRGVKVESYELSVGEARQLYADLKAKGYERF